MRDEDIQKIVETYQHRTEEARYARCVSLKEIAENDYNLNISRYVSTACAELIVDLNAVHDNLQSLTNKAATERNKHNEFLQKLGLSLLP